MGVVSSMVNGRAPIPEPRKRPPIGRAHSTYPETVAPAACAARASAARVRSTRSPATARSTTESGMPCSADSSHAARRRSRTADSASPRPPTSPCGGERSPRRTLSSIVETLAVADVIAWDIAAWGGVPASNSRTSPRTVSVAVVRSERSRAPARARPINRAAVAVMTPQASAMGQDHSVPSTTVTAVAIASRRARTDFCGRISIGAGRRRPKAPCRRAVRRGWRTVGRACPGRCPSISRARPIWTPRGAAGQASSPSASRVAVTGLTTTHQPHARPTPAPARQRQPDRERRRQPRAAPGRNPLASR